VADTLHLEFACTDAEKEQAQALHLQRRVGGGSKALTTIVLLLVLAGMLLGFYVRVGREVSAAHRPYVYAAVVGIAFVAWLLKRRTRSAAAVMTGVDVSDDGLRVRATGAEVHLPWSAFSRLLDSPELFVLVDRSGTTLLTFPRRVFPDEASQDWFQTLAVNRLGLAEPSAAPAPVATPADPGQSVGLRIDLRFSDFVDRSLTSWRVRGFLAAFVALMTGITIVTAASPPPNAVYSATQVYFMFILPFLLVTSLVVVLGGSVLSWWSHSRRAAAVDLVLSPDSIAFSGPEGSGALPWSTYDRFKETRRSFFLWKSSGASAWMLLPKRAFATVEEADRCRDMLSSHLRPSSWFFG